MNKLMIATAILATAFVANTSFAKSKASKSELKAYKAACKEENPGAKKAEINKCVKEKAKAKTEA